jgi:hypothetical protein
VEARGSRPYMKHGGFVGLRWRQQYQFLALFFVKKVIFEKELKNKDNFQHCRMTSFLAVFILTFWVVH